MRRPPSALGRSGARRPQTAPLKRPDTVLPVFLEQEWLRSSSPCELSPPTSPEVKCGLRRCSGKRGCLCPKSPTIGQGRVFHHLLSPAAESGLTPPKPEERPTSPSSPSPSASPENGTWEQLQLSADARFCIVGRTIREEHDESLVAKLETILAGIQAGVLANVQRSVRQ